MEGGEERVKKVEGGKEGEGVKKVEGGRRG